MRIFTIGYGGRKPEEFLALLVSHDVRGVVDVRLRPDRASMGCYTRAKTADKGIQALLARAGIKYASVVELGNVFLEWPDWRDAYRQLLDRAGDLLTTRLSAAGLGLSEPLCLLCAEKSPSECHRGLIAEWLQSRGHEMQHIT